LKLSTVVIFTLFSVGAIFAFGYYSFLLMLDLFNSEDIIAFNKGAMYMLGVGLSSGLLTYFMIYEIIKREISESFNKRATLLSLIFMASIFIFPQIVDYGIRQYINHIGYIFCTDKSYRWLHAQNLVFATNEETCVKYDSDEL